MKKRKLGKSNLEISAIGLGLPGSIAARKKATPERTPDDLREIDGAASKITVQGARYPEKLEQMTGR